MTAPEGRESQGRSPVLRQFPRLAHQPSVEAQSFDAAPFQFGFHVRIDRDRFALVSPGPQDPRRVGRGGYAEDRFGGRTGDDIEARPMLGDSGCEGLERLREPPSRRAAPRAAVGGSFVMDIDEKRRAVSGGGNRGLIVKTEVAAQPDDIDAHADAPRTKTRDLRSGGRAVECRRSSAPSVQPATVAFVQINGYCPPGTGTLTA